MGMKTTVETADRLFEEARDEARRSQVTLRELIETGLRRVLDERRSVNAELDEDYASATR